MKTTSTSKRVSLKGKTLLTTQKTLPLCNASGVWRSGSATQKFNDWVGLTMALVTLVSKDGHRASVGLVKIRVQQKYKVGAVGMYATKEGLSLTPMQPLPKTDYTYFEADVEPETGNLKFWINDTGLDMGNLTTFKGGAVYASWGATTGSPQDHLINGCFSDCMMAVVGHGWTPANLNQTKIRSTKPNHQIQVVSTNKVSFSDKRAVT